ncbi:hypothetical protein NPIL_309661 [Nephila pilipes]|uniref:Uncharacterized protein n=1 Tax=Nephila pilipes TaxID=299642 RepID=A0A8X6QH39_NEPPI|nr:hypothetical protein NPIL_309661 [Nephila pilipes]
MATFALRPKRQVVSHFQGQDPIGCAIRTTTGFLARERLFHLQLKKEAAGFAFSIIGCRLCRGYFQFHPLENGQRRKKNKMIYIVIRVVSWLGKSVRMFTDSVTREF